jgi:hypothetical protein
MNLKEALGYLEQLKQLRRFVGSHPKLSQSYTRLTPKELAGALGQVNPRGRG